jgi:transposase InsO family protein
LIYGFIDEQRAAGRGVESICRVLRERGLPVAPHSYRAWKTNPPSARTVGDAQLVDMLRHLKTGGPKGQSLPEVLHGRRKMTAWLARNGFPDVSKHTVDRLMRQECMRGLIRGRKTRTTIPAKDGRRARDLLNRCFRTGAPNRAWVTDFTHVSTWSGFVYVAFAIDLYSRAIVGWAASATKDVAFVEFHHGSAQNLSMWPVRCLSDRYGLGTGSGAEFRNSRRGRDRRPRWASFLSGWRRQQAGARAGSRSGCPNRWWGPSPALPDSR